MTQKPTRILHNTKTHKYYPQVYDSFLWIFKKWRPIYTYNIYNEAYVTHCNDLEIAKNIIDNYLINPSLNKKPIKQKRYEYIKYP